MNSKNSWRVIAVFLVFFLGVFAWCGPNAVAQETNEEPEYTKVKLGDLSKHVGQDISTVMEVQAVRFSKSKAWCYLISSAKESKKDKLTLVFKTKGRKAFQLEGIDDPTEKFKGKRIRVRGSLIESAGKLQVEILEFKQIKIVGVRPKSS